MNRLKQYLPNALSISRLLLALVFIFFPHQYRLVVLIFAGLTDFFDGMLARRWKVQSEFGRIIDPIADRTFAAVMALTFLVEARLSLIQLVLVGIRDIIVIVGSIVVLLAGRRRDFKKIRTRFPGKAATAVQFAFLISLLFLDEALWSLVIIVSLFSIAAAIDYIWYYFMEVLPAPMESEKMA